MAELIHPTEEALASALRAHGVPLLTGRASGATMSAADLIAAAVRRGAPSRARSCLVPLFLVRPDAVDMVRRLVPVLPADDAETLRLLFTAAVYLQRKWQTRLRLAVGARPALPDLFGGALGLPSPDEYFGIWGLQALSELCERQGAPSGLVAESEAMTRLLMETAELAA